MGCCGRPFSGAMARPAPASASPQKPAVPPLRPLPRPVFQYVGRTALTVVGGATRTSYRFAAPGARLAVEPADAPSLMRVPQLRRLTV